MKTRNKKTNEELLKQLIEELSMFELALLRERILTIMDATEDWAKEELKNPSKGAIMIHPQAYLDLSANVKKIIGFNE